MCSSSGNKAARCCTFPVERLITAIPSRKLSSVSSAVSAVMTRFLEMTDDDDDDDDVSVNGGLAMHQLPQREEGE